MSFATSRAPSRPLVSRYATAWIRDQRRTEESLIGSDGRPRPTRPGYGAAMPPKERAQAAFATVEGELQQISRWMYENPETAYEEYESSARLAAFLADHGFEVTYSAYGLETAFEASVGSAGPRVVICCEYDALPGVGHACGHNIIAASSLGAAVALRDLVDELGIRLTVLGTPAEEGGGGKLDLIEAGAFEDVAASMMIHPSIHNLVDPRLLAAQGMEVTYRGKEAHAAATPHEGLNALDAFVTAYNAISILRQQFEPGDRVHGVIDKGGVAPNVIPALTSSRWIVRALTATRFESLRARVLDIFEASARTTGCEVEIEFEGEPYIDLASNPVMAELFAANATSLGRPMPTRAESGIETSASSDMGNVSHVVPSIHPSLAIDTESVNHQPGFAAATITPSGERVIRDGAVAMAHTIIDMAAGDVWDEL